MHVTDARWAWQRWCSGAWAGTGTPGCHSSGQQWVTVGAVARYSARQVAPAGLLVVGLGFLGLDSLDSPTS